MKLFTKYNRINIAATVIIFLLTGIAFFFVLRYILIDQVDEYLEYRQYRIEQYAKMNQQLPPPVITEDEQTIYTAAGQNNFQKKRQIQTISVFETAEQEDALRRQIQFTVAAANQQWLVTITKSLEDTDDLLQSVIVISLVTILLILAAAFFINRFVLQKLWQPFYTTLDAVKNFQLGGKQKIHLNKTGIDEFDAMNTTLEQSINKAEDDYRLLKEFTENASHELQTPLAIIRSKLDVLIQDEHLSQQQSDAIKDAYNAIQRLSRLNQSLLLLAKIENRQFEERAQLNLKEKMEIKLQHFNELLQSRGLHVSVTLEDAVMHINETLADILLSNLLSNAIKHNCDGGKITISINHGELRICNTGAAQPLDEEKLFSRFYKTNAAAENNGLGLSVVKEVCEASHCSIVYEFEKPDKHVFLVRW
ncbi:MAG TPA: HAMP domain-containing sensor histidine kinase [Chitinophagaceae bacterium]|nr:HAMP domain-containing sensor histidine kinase [Chitinophagaceae bacterium]